MLALLLTLLLQAEAPVQLWWDAPAGDLQGYGGYILRWGTESGQYTHSLTMDMSATSAEVMVGTGTTWYFAVQAFLTAGGRTGFSNEVRVVVPAGEPTKPGRRKRPNAVAVLQAPAGPWTVGGRGPGMAGPPNVALRGLQDVESGSGDGRVGAQ